MRIIHITDVHLMAGAPASRKDDFSQTMLNKLESIASHCTPEDLVIFSGDLTNTSILPIWYVINIIKTLRTFPSVPYTIVGNHEVSNNTKEPLSKSVLGLLISTGNLKRLESLFIEVPGRGEVEIVALDFNEKQPNQVDVRGKIVVCHHFISREVSIFPEEETWFTHEIEKQGPLLVLAGHDHQTHPVTKVGESVVMRPGALSRGTKHGFQKVREVYFGSVDFTTGSLEYIPVPCSPASEVFSEDTLTYEKAKGDLKSFVIKLRESKTKGTKIEEVISSMNLKRPVLDLLFTYLKEEQIIVPKLT